MKKVLFLIVIISLTLSCDKNKSEISDNQEVAMHKINISSNSFKNNERIPAKYTCQGDETSPPLHWDNIPKNTKSIAIICDDPDAPAGTWIHWIIFNIPPKMNELTENFPHESIMDNGIKQGLNSSNFVGYQGPCPPSGEHRYFFKIYALDIILDIGYNIHKEDLLSVIETHILGYGEMIGLYEKK